MIVRRWAESRPARGIQLDVCDAAIEHFEPPCAPAARIETRIPDQGSFERGPGCVPEANGARRPSAAGEQPDIVSRVLATLRSGCADVGQDIFLNMLLDRHAIHADDLHTGNDPGGRQRPVVHGGDDHLAFEQSGLKARPELELLADRTRRHDVGVGIVEPGAELHQRAVVFGGIAGFTDLLNPGEVERIPVEIGSLSKNGKLHLTSDQKRERPAIFSASVRFSL